MDELCSLCSGTHWMPGKIKDEIDPCPECNADGKIPPSGTLYADSVPVSNSSRTRRRVAAKIGIIGPENRSLTSPEGCVF